MFGRPSGLAARRLLWLAVLACEGPPHQSSDGDGGLVPDAADATPDVGLDGQPPADGSDGNACVLPETACGDSCCPTGADCVEDVCIPPDLIVDSDAAAQSLTLLAQSFAADSCELEETCIGALGERRLFAFTLEIANLGPGDLVVPPPADDNPLFEWSPCHGHYHLLDFVSFELVADNGTIVWSRKQSFCLASLLAYLPDAQPLESGGGCNRIQAGWADLYVVGTPCQWLDVTDVEPGPYTLRVTVNPIGVLTESDATNNAVEIAIELPVCGDDICDEIEQCASCAEDCGACTCGSFSSSDECCLTDDPCGLAEDDACACAGECDWDAIDCGAGAESCQPEECGGSGGACSCEPGCLSKGDCCWNTCFACLAC